MDTHQQSFIETVRQALGKSPRQTDTELFGPPPQDVDAQLGSYLNKSSSDKLKLLELFNEQAQLAQINVAQVDNPEKAASSIRHLIENSEPEWGTAKSVIAWHHPLVEQLRLEDHLKDVDVDLHIAKGSDIPDVTERNAIRNKIVQSYIGITSADFCVAQSATLVMRTRPNQPRAISLVPSIHVAVITIDQLIEDLKELYFRLKWDPAQKEQGVGNCMTFISGPSKTADIELQMVFGAHGPRQLHVYVLSES